MNPWTTAAAVVLFLAILKFARPKGVTTIVTRTGPMPVGRQITVDLPISDKTEEISKLKAQSGLDPQGFFSVYGLGHSTLYSKKTPFYVSEKKLGPKRFGDIKFIGPKRQGPAEPWRGEPTPASTPDDPNPRPPPSAAFSPKDGKLFDPDRARELAEEIDSEIRRLLGFYSPEKVWDFEKACGLEPSGRYDGYVKGALEYWNQRTAPEPIHAPKRTVAYLSPG